MTLDHAWIAAHIPHQGAMCLLESVVMWNAERIECLAVSHRDGNNPLRSHGRLGAACALEYAAQAAAVHGALTCLGPREVPVATTPAGAAAAEFGLLVSARSVRLQVARLDDIDVPLRISAERLHAERQGALYAFQIAGSACVASGRLSLLLPGPAP